MENLFQRLGSALHSEVRTLGQPRATLLMFAMAVVAFNVHYGTESLRYAILAAMSFYAIAAIVFFFASRWFDRDWE